MDLTGKQRFLQTLRFEEPDRPPHFEAMFELEREAFGLQFPDRHSWGGCTRAEKERQIGTCIEIYQRIVARYRWDALTVYWPWGDPDGVRAAKKTFGDQIAIGGMVGGGVWCIDQIRDWETFSADMVERRDQVHAEAERRCRDACDRIDRLVDAGADFIYLPHDVAFNSGTFCSPKDFAEIVTPYLARLIARVKERRAIAFFHTDGNIISVLDQILACEPHALQSIDPMAGMDIAEVKQRTYGKMAIMGNVQCSFLQTGPREDIRRSTLYCLEHAAPGGGFLFSSSNTIFPGVPLENYEYMLELFRAVLHKETPMKNRTSPHLSKEQVAFFRQQGYLLYEQPVFSPKKFTALKAYFEELLASLPPEQRPENMDVPHFQHPRLNEWLLDEEVLDLIEPLLGPDIALFSSHFICKPRGNGKRVPWHEDSAYWKTMLEPMEVVTVWLALDPSTTENGCMYVIPGTHNSGRKGFSDYDPVDTEKNVFHIEITPTQRTDARAVPCVLQPNQASLHDGRLMHGSPPNTSAIRRCGYTMRYMPAHVKINAEAAKWQNLYLARGRDKAGNAYADPIRAYPELARFREQHGKRGH